MELLTATSAASLLDTPTLYIMVAFNVLESLGIADPRNGIADPRFRIGRLVDRKNACGELYGFRYARRDGAEGERCHHG